ncbi:MAG: ATP-binding cassette domain-containing protein [Acidimicrobiia bacterium]|nr:ATP-binding cassette domain-containing protein [Acidimicrobiia bacterium]
MPALELRDVRKVYRSGDAEVVALDHATLTVADDEIVALVGPSGSGKTTLLSIAGGLLSPTSGTVVVRGEDVTGYSARELTRFRREQVGFVFQQVNLVPFLTARENLLVAAELAGRGTVAGPGPISCSRSWGWPTGPATSPASSRAASVSGWRSGGRS